MMARLTKKEKKGLRLFALHVTEQTKALPSLVDTGWRSQKLMNIWKNSDVDSSAALCDAGRSDTEALKDRFWTE